MKIKRKVVLALLLVMILTLSSCQPTPETEVVIAKDNTEKAIQESAMSEQNKETEREPYEAPDHIDKRFSVVEGVQDIEINADVYVPDVTSFPVAKVKEDQFTQERADELREYFMQDGELFSQHVFTKSDYDEWIIEAKQGHEVDGEMVFDEDSQEWVDELIERRSKAPEKDEPQIVTDYFIGGEDGLNGRIMLNGEELGSLYIKKASFGYYKSVNYREASRTYFDMNDKKIENISTCSVNMTLEQAEQRVDEVLSDLKIEGLSITFSDVVYFVEDDDYLGEAKSAGYTFKLVREFGGLTAVLRESFGIGPDDKYDVSPPIAPECLNITIDENGEIVQFYWRNPAKVIETMTEHVDILPFEDILQRLEDFSKLQYGFISEYSSDVLMVKRVHDIGLHLNYLPLKNNPSEFMLAPCWYFTYKDSQDYTQEQLDWFESQGREPMSDEMMSDEHFIFSAVDGSSVSEASLKDIEDMNKMREEYENEQ